MSTPARYSSALLSLTAAASLIGCSTQPSTNEATSAQATGAGCASLLGASIRGGTITSAEDLPAGTVPVFGGAAPIPAHCKLQAKLNERIGIDGKPYAIGMELRIPANWNGRLLFQGGGGTDGELRPAIGGGSVGDAPNALSLGYAVVSTDAGHLNEPGMTGPYLFGADPQARADYGYNHLPVVTHTARSLIERLHRKPPERSYFVGCSNGGRQGMMASQRFPDLFDGIVVIAPANRVTDASLDALVQTQVLAAIAPQGSDGRPQLGAALSSSDLDTLGKGILDACDALDGAVDGMVLHPAQCNFDPASIQCDANRTENCLAPAKADAIRKLFAGSQDAAGKPIYTRWAYDPGVNSPLWTMWKMGPPDAVPPRAANTTLVAGAMSHVFSTPPQLIDDLYGFMLTTQVDELRERFRRTEPPFTESGEYVVNATSTDLSAFASRGGKLLFLHGMADGIFAPQDSIDYFESVQARHGKQAEDFTRLYLVPGMGHCGGGPATDSYDALGAVVQWVEQGKAPGPLLAKAGPGSPFKGRTRPLCAYPQQATYKGGDIESASSFECR
jgi:pimeloyl-ACP methyl ester carboxylesterase